MGIIILLHLLPRRVGRIKQGRGWSRALPTVECCSWEGSILPPFTEVEEPLLVATDERKPNSTWFEEEKYSGHNNKKKNLGFTSFRYSLIQRLKWNPLESDLSPSLSCLFSLPAFYLGSSQRLTWFLTYNLPGSNPARKRECFSLNNSGEVGNLIVAAPNQVM